MSGPFRGVLVTITVTEAGVQAAVPALHLDREGQLRVMAVGRAGRSRRGYDMVALMACVPAECPFHDQRVNGLR